MYITCSFAYSQEDNLSYYVLTLIKAVHVLHDHTFFMINTNIMRYIGNTFKLTEVVHIVFDGEHLTFYSTGKVCPG